MGPELIAPHRFGFKSSRPTKPSDCYALGMVVYETISGNLPFHEHTDLTVFVKVLEGERPRRGVGFTKSLWEMLKLCWASQPNDRPSIEDVLQCLEMAPDLSEPPPPEVDEEMEKDDSDWDSASGSSGVPSGQSGAMATERSATTSSGLSYLVDCQLSPTSTSSVTGAIGEGDTGGLGCEATDLVLSVPQYSEIVSNLEEAERDGDDRDSANGASTVAPADGQPHADVVGLTKIQQTSAVWSSLSEFSTALFSHAFYATGDERKEERLEIAL